VGDDPGDPLGRGTDARDASARIGDNHPGLEDYPLGPEGLSGGVDAPRERLHFSGKMPLLSPFSRLFPFFLALALIVVCLQGMGIIKDSVPPVPEDKELRAKNWARNEEQKKAKEAKKAKSARKAQRRKTADKSRREAEKVGLPVPESPETSVSEIEGGGARTGSTSWRTTRRRRMK